MKLFLLFDPKLLFLGNVPGTFETAYAQAVAIWDAFPHNAELEEACNGISIQDDAGNELFLIDYVTHER